MSVTMDFGDGLAWRKSTRSGDNGGMCVYVTMDFGDSLTWRKSTRSSDNGGMCVYVAESSAAGRIGVRDSKEGASGRPQWYHPAAWATFIEGVKSGELALT